MIANLFASRVRGGEKKKPPQAVRRVEVIQRFRKSLLEIADNLVSVGSTITSTRDVDPVIFTIAGLHD